MSGPGAGFESPPVAVSWLKRDVLLFAVSIGATVDELPFVFEQDGDFKVFPSYANILQFKKNSQEVVDFASVGAVPKIPGVPEFKLDRLIDAQRSLTFYKQLPTSSEGRNFELRQKVVGVYDKGKSGSVLETESLVVDKSSGETYVRSVGSMFFIGQGNWGGPKGPSRVNYPPPGDRAPNAVGVFQTNSQTPLVYRYYGPAQPNPPVSLTMNAFSLNGDYNRLHVTQELGKSMGFGGPIMHGLFTFNVACHAVLKELGSSDPANMREFSARFAAPVKPGDKLVTEMWRTGEYSEGWEDVRFLTRVEGGKTVLSNGKAMMKPVNTASKI